MPAILIGLAIAFIVVVVIIFAARYKTCPSDKVLVVYGKTAGAKAAKCIHGGAAFIIPIIQQYEYLSLRPMQIEVNLDNALCKQNIRISVPSIFTVGITTETGVMGNAAERLLGLFADDISDLAKDIIFGQLRLVIASMTIEEINADRETFLRSVEQNVTQELNKVGLALLNVNITDITDESGYIEAIGRRAAAEAINQAKIEVAEEDRKGSVGEAEAQKEQRIAVAEAEAQAKSGEAESDRARRIAVAEADSLAQSGEAKADRDKRVAIKEAEAKAIEGENLSAIEIAKSTAARNEEQAEAFRRTEVAQKIADAEIQREKYLAEQKAELSRAEMEKAKQIAEVIVPANIAKEQVEIKAEAEAEKRRREAKGEADAIFAKLDAEARGNFEILKAKGTGFNEIISSCKDADAAAKMLIIEKLENIVALQTEAIKNIKIDKVTVWEGGSSKDGKTSTSNFLSGMMQSLPPLHDVANMAGIELPEFLGKVKGEEDTAEIPVVEAEPVVEA